MGRISLWEISKERKHFLGYLSLGRCGKVVFQNGEHPGTFSPVFIVTKQELVEGVTFENGEDSICYSHGCFDIVEFARDDDMFKLAYLA